MDILDSYKHTTAALGTKHNKQVVIGPLFKKHLGMEVVIPNSFDTDTFGTFTRDVTRLNSQKNTAALKARAAMKELGLDIGIASEGSFGPHPLVPFGTANTEIVVFIDAKNKLEIYGMHVEAAPYAQSGIVSSVDEIISFARSIDFPQHGIVMRPGEKKYEGMVKGIKDEAELESAAKLLLANHKTIWVETDLRAHVNESRMQHIALATQDLISNIQRLCPQCDMPGFHRIASKPGLPCEHCTRPTGLPLADTYQCDTCGHTNEVQFPDNKETAYAGYCDYCNP